MGATAGQSFGPGQNVEIEYACVIRPVGSNVPAGNITIYVLEMGAVAQEEIAADAGSGRQGVETGACSDVIRNLPRQLPIAPKAHLSYKQHKTLLELPHVRRIVPD